MSNDLERQIQEARSRAEIFAKSLEEAREQERKALKVKKILNIVVI